MLLLGEGVAMARTFKIQGQTPVILFENGELRARLRGCEGFGKMGMGDHKVKNKDLTLSPYQM